MKTNEHKAKAARYLKIVEWSDEDKCFVGRCPGLFHGGCHGDNEADVYRELCEIAEEWIGILEGDGKPLPEPTAGKNYSGKFVVRIDPDLHKGISLRAQARGESLNQYVAEALAHA